MDDGLPFKEVGSAFAQSLVETVPYVGIGISTYFKMQDEKRFKRLEMFYEDLSKKFEKLEHAVLDSSDPERMIGIIESIHEQVEKVNSKNKQKFLVNAYKNLVLHTENKDFDLDEYFVELLSSLSNVELEVLAFYFNNMISTTEERITDQDKDQDLLRGACNRLSDFGLFKKIQLSIMIGGEENFEYSLSMLGEKFYRFVLT
ncbi:hypothetical protein [Enterococcus sp. DIV0187]|uniref:hypothetical protein n=1 Tax=Enterococcus sp. DIV0187 TaxID=2774644 RepID=UPI003F23BC94